LCLVKQQFAINYLYRRLLPFVYVDPMHSLNPLPDMNSCINIYDSKQEHFVHMRTAGAGQRLITMLTH
jgi:hypothetical protein